MGSGVHYNARKIIQIEIEGEREALKGRKHQKRRQA